MDANPSKPGEDSHDHLETRPYRSQTTKPLSILFAELRPHPNPPPLSLWVVPREMLPHNPDALPRCVSHTGLHSKWTNGSIRLDPGGPWLATSCQLGAFCLKANVTHEGYRVRTRAQVEPLPRQRANHLLPTLQACLPSCPEVRLEHRVLCFIELTWPLGNYQGKSF